MTNKIIIITGQTATGKTKFALEYAKKIKGELINCDSRQIYKYLDIITGKDKQPVARVKAWLYDVVKPNEYFSSFDFVKLAVPIIKKILDEGKTPIVIGGTYFYLHHLLYNLETENIAPNWRLRKKLDNKSVAELQSTLRSLNPLIFRKLNQSEKNNPQRLTRRIEILTHIKKQTALEPARLRSEAGLPIVALAKMGEPRRLNEKLAKKLGIKNLNINFIGLKFKNKESLRKAIEKRVEERLKLGAIEEARKLLRMGYTEADPGLKTIGYQQILTHLRGGLTKDEAINQWISKEIQYAKRQLTFMKRDENIKWKLV